MGSRSFMVPTLPIHLVHTKHSTNYTHLILSIMPDTLTHLYDDGLIKGLILFLTASFLDSFRGTEMPCLMTLTWNFLIKRLCFLANSLNFLSYLKPCFISLCVNSVCFAFKALKLSQILPILTSWDMFTL